jgi:hypothetical protein
MPLAGTGFDAPALATPQTVANGCLRNLPRLAIIEEWVCIASPRTRFHGEP